VHIPAAEMFVPPLDAPPGEHDHLTRRWRAARDRILHRELTLDILNLNERQRDALRMRMAGFTHKWIGVVLDVTERGAGKLIESAIKSAVKDRHTHPKARKAASKEAYQKLKDARRKKEGRAPIDPMEAAPTNRAQEDAILRVLKARDCSAAYDAIAAGAWASAPTDDNPMAVGRRIKKVEYNRNDDQIGGFARSPRMVAHQRCCPLYDAKIEGAKTNDPHAWRRVWQPAVREPIDEDARQRHEIGHVGRHGFFCCRKGKPGWIAAGAIRLPRIAWDGDEENCPLPREWRCWLWWLLADAAKVTVSPDHIARALARAERRALMLELDRRGDADSDPPPPALPDAGIMPGPWLLLQSEWHRQARTRGGLQGLVLRNYTFAPAKPRKEVVVVRDISWEEMRAGGSDRKVRVFGPTSVATGYGSDKGDHLWDDDWGDDDVIPELTGHKGGPRVDVNWWRSTTKILILLTDARQPARLPVIPTGPVPISDMIECGRGPHWLVNREAAVALRLVGPEECNHRCHYRRGVA
jgi:hypothetical protein